MKCCSQSLSSLRPVPAYLNQIQPPLHVEAREYASDFSIIWLQRWSAPVIVICQFATTRLTEDDGALQDKGFDRAK